MNMNGKDMNIHEIRPKVIFALKNTKASKSDASLL